MLYLQAEPSPEGQFLADRINKFVLDSETSPDDNVYYTGEREFHNIKREITFITDRGLSYCLRALNINGRKVVQKHFLKYFEKQMEVISINLDEINYIS